MCLDEKILYGYVSEMFIIFICDDFKCFVYLIWYKCYLCLEIYELV